MGLTSADIPLLLQSGLKTEFMTGMGSYTPKIAPVVTTYVTSTKDKETYAWLGDTPKMKRWISERTPKALREHGFTLINEDWEDTIEVDRNALDDDQYGQVMIRAKQLGMAAQVFYDEQCSAVIEAGTSAVCYDGQYFFDTDHSEGDSGTQSNAPAAGSGYKVDTAAKALTVAKAVSAAMIKFKTDTGKFAHAKLTHVMVPPSLEWIFREAFDPTFTGAGGATPSAIVGQKMGLQVIVNEYLTDTATLGCAPVYWMDLSKPVKPFIWQNRKDPEFTSLDQPDSPDRFWRKKLYYGVDLRVVFGYADWRYCYRTEGQ